MPDGSALRPLLRTKGQALRGALSQYKDLLSTRKVRPGEDADFVLPEIEDALQESKRLVRLYSSSPRNPKMSNKHDVDTLGTLQGTVETFDHGNREASGLWKLAPSPLQHYSPNFLGGGISYGPSWVDDSAVEVNYLGSLIPGLGRDLLHEMRAMPEVQGKDLVLDILDTPHTDKFYREMGFKPGKRIGGDTDWPYDYWLPKDEPFARAEGGLVRKGVRSVIDRITTRDFLERLRPKGPQHDMDHVQRSAISDALEFLDSLPEYRVDAEYFPEDEGLLGLMVSTPTEVYTGPGLADPRPGLHVPYLMAHPREQGTGTRLLKYRRDIDPDLPITLQSTSNSDGFYRGLGFEDYERGNWLMMPAGKRWLRGLGAGVAGEETLSNNREEVIPDYAGGGRVELPRFLMDIAKKYGSKSWQFKKTYEDWLEASKDMEYPEGDELGWPYTRGERALARNNPHAVPTLAKQLHEENEFLEDLINFPGAANVGGFPSNTNRIAPVEKAGGGPVSGHEALASLDPAWYDAPSYAGGGPVSRRGILTGLRDMFRKREAPAIITRMPEAAPTGNLPAIVPATESELEQLPQLNQLLNEVAGPQSRRDFLRRGAGAIASHVVDAPSMMSILRETIKPADLVVDPLPPAELYRELGKNFPSYNDVEMMLEGLITREKYAHVPRKAGRSIPEAIKDVVQVFDELSEGSIEADQLVRRAMKEMLDHKVQALTKTHKLPEAQAKTIREHADENLRHFLENETFIAAMEDESPRRVFRDYMEGAPEDSRMDALSYISQSDIVPGDRMGAFLEGTGHIDRVKSKLDEALEYLSDMDESAEFIPTGGQR